MIGQVLRYIGVLPPGARAGRIGRIRQAVRRSHHPRPAAGGATGRAIGASSARLPAGSSWRSTPHEIDFMLPHPRRGHFRQRPWANRFINLANDYEDFITAQHHLRRRRDRQCHGNQLRLPRALHRRGLSQEGHHLLRRPQLPRSTPRRRAKSNRRYPTATSTPSGKAACYREMREFVEACLGEHAVTIPGEDGMRVVEVAEACYRSINEGGHVALPLPRN